MGFSSGQLAQAAMVGQIGATTMGTVGSYYSAKGQRIALKSQANMAEINARIAEQGAQAELQRGQREEQSVRLRAAQIKSAQRVAMAANGLDLGSDTNVELATSADLMGEIDANTIAANAVRSAWGYRTQAVNYQIDAMGKRSAAKQISPVGSAVSTLLTGAGQVAGSWSQLNKTGALDEFKANMSSDPIGSMGKARGWWKG